MLRVADMAMATDRIFARNWCDRDDMTQIIIVYTLKLWCLKYHRCDLSWKNNFWWFFWAYIPSTTIALIGLKILAGVLVLEGIITGLRYQPRFPIYLCLFNGLTSELNRVTLEFRVEHPIYERYMFYLTSGYKYLVLSSTRLASTGSILKILTKIQNQYFKLCRVSSAYI